MFPDPDDFADPSLRRQTQERPGPSPACSCHQDLCERVVELTVALNSIAFTLDQGVGRIVDAILETKRGQYVGPC